MLINTLKWRREFKPEKIQPYHVQEEAKQGMNYLNGFDKEGRPVIYMRSRRQTSTDWDTQLKLMVFLFESALKISKSDSFILIIDYIGYSFSNAPSMSQSMEVLKVFNDHYPGKRMLTIKRTFVQNL